MEIVLIAAMAANRVIGRGSTIPWDIPGEQTRFKKITMGHSLIMGRKTWESIGRPLPGRRNIVVTRNSEFQALGAEVVHSLEQGFALVKGEGEEKVFVIGGAQLYRLSLERADTLILTELEQEVEGDAFFPAFSCPPFELVRTEEVEEPMRYRIRTYQRRKGARKGQAG
ncbi:dihydrofolate reductase [Candidatus Electrothrix marina]|uniref:Dihydrofolate reductase n=1 Tax=Candidatus Electrothrix marina TaxID=1859130 RepID=A0A3S3QW69_9BACT|nr:dihydrofolate reductase [Candidatus Electrothrix marina]